MRLQPSASCWEFMDGFFFLYRECVHTSWSQFPEGPFFFFFIREDDMYMEEEGDLDHHLLHSIPDERNLQMGLFHLFHHWMIQYHKYCYCHHRWQKQPMYYVGMSSRRSVITTRNNVHIVVDVVQDQQKTLRKQIVARITCLAVGVVGGVAVVVDQDRSHLQLKLMLMYQY